MSPSVEDALPEGAKEKLEVQNWVVGFFDLLGQRDALRRMDFLPDRADHEKVEALVAAVRGSVGAIRMFYRLFETFRAAATSPPDGTLVDPMTPEKRRTFEELRATRIGHARFSDGVMSYCSLVPSPQHFPIRACYEMVCAAGSMMLTSLAWGHPMRGGIDVGTGIEVEPGDLHGPAMVKAYELESKAAEYPRVVVGQTFTDYLKTTVEGQGTVPDVVRADLAQTVREMLRQDGDGQTIVDYMGERFKQCVSSQVDRRMIHMARQFAVDQHDCFTKNNNVKLRSRYERLMDYIASRTHIWV